MSDTNEYEERNRAARVYKIVRLIEKRTDWTADDLADASPESWEMIGQMAKAPNPSDRTKAIVLHILRERSDG